MRNVGLCSEGVRREVAAPAVRAQRPLVLCIAKGAGDGQDAVQAVLDDRPACGLDALPLIGAGGLVVLGEGDNVAPTAEDGAAVTAGVGWRGENR